MADGCIGTREATRYFHLSVVFVDRCLRLSRWVDSMGMVERRPDQASQRPNAALHDVDSFLFLDRDGLDPCSSQSGNDYDGLRARHSPRINEQKAVDSVVLDGVFLRRRRESR